jgi:hypothetical protein
MMVSLMFATRCALFSQSHETTIPKGSLLDFTVFKAMFLVNALKIICTHEFSGSFKGDDMDTDEHSVSKGHLISLYTQYNIYNNGQKNVSAIDIVAAIKRQSQTFLRCCCLFFSCITDVELPSELAELHGDTFDIMASYLGMY